MFENLTNEGLEETQDRLGGFQPFATDIYEGDIKVAYAGKSAGGASNVTLLVDIGGKEYRETIYITNREGKNWYPNKADKTKKVPLPGFTTIDDLCLVTTENPLASQETEEKTLNIWDPEQSKEVPKAVPVLVGLTGKKAYFAIQQSIENKSEKQGNDYVPTAETRDVNNIEKVFHFPTKMTVVEARNGLEGPDFFEKWVERNKGQIRDKREIKDGEAGQAGRPGGAAPSAGNKAPKQSLFGNS